VKSANEIAAGSTVAVTNLLRAIEYQKQEVAELIAKNDKLEADIENIKEARKESQANLTAALIESRDIRIDNVEKEKRIGKLERGMINQGKYIDTLKTAMQEAGLPVPLNGEVMDSVRNMQLSIEERERLKAGK
jgi:predicted RNase H-like nuclease (RuvC/YqgF family)